MGASLLARATYRSLLRCCRTLEDNPALKALLQSNNEELPDEINSIFRAYLSRREYYLPYPPPKYTLVERAKQGCKLMRKSQSIEDGLASLRYLHSVIEKGTRYGLINSEEQIAASPKKIRVEPVSEPAGGVVLLAHPMLTGWFNRTVILLVNYGPGKSTNGVCLNRPLNLTLGDLKARMDKAMAEGPQGETKFVDIAGWGRLRLKKQTSEVPSPAEQTLTFQEHIRDAHQEAKSFVHQMEEKELKGEALREDEAEAVEAARKFLSDDTFRSGNDPEGEQSLEGRHVTLGSASETVPEYSDEDSVAVRESSGGVIEEIHITGLEDDGNSLSCMEVSDEEDEDEEVSVRVPQTFQMHSDSGANPAPSTLSTNAKLNRLHSGGPVMAMSMFDKLNRLGGDKVLDGTTEYADYSRLLWQDVWAYNNADARFFLGESVWDNGQLEKEIKRGVWILCKASPEDLDVMDKGHWDQSEAGGDIGQLWYRLMRGLGGEFKSMAGIPIELALEEWGIE